MQPCLTAEQMRTADRYTIDRIGIPESVLMEQAALAVFRVLQNRFGSSLSTTFGMIVAGHGNNGGDAIALARLLFQGGIQSFSLVTIGSPANWSPAAKSQLKIGQRLGIKVGTKLEASSLANCHWVVDGLFGTGLKRAVEGKQRETIGILNNAKRVWKLAIDVPSGLCSDTGTPMGECFCADETITLGFLKRGLFTGEGAEYAGRVSLAEIQIPRKIPGIASIVERVESSDIAGFLPPRRAAGNKGIYGHTYIWSGVPEKEGASGLVCLAAYRSGSGLVSLVIPESESPIQQVTARLPFEVMVASESSALFAKPGIGVVGPGFGLERRHKERLTKILLSPWPLVIDGDALTLIAEDPKHFFSLLRSRKSATILTPHPKEAARLLGVTVVDIQKDRFSALEKLIKITGSTIVLKGRGTLIGANQHPIWLIDRGNSALSKGGTGDILAGLVGSFLAQGCVPKKAAAVAVYLHGRAAEYLSQQMGTERSLIASDLTTVLPPLLRELEENPPCK